jgi:hypothetical protein
VTIRARASALAIFTAVACAGTVVGVTAQAAAAPPSPAAPPARDACADALTYERTAASDAVTRQAAYDSSVAGLTVNQTCANPQQRLVNEAYLLSMRAAAARELNVGDWRRDLARANQLLTQCSSTQGLARKAADDCRTQLQFNHRYEAAATAPATGASPPPAPPSPRPPGGGNGTGPRSKPSL